MSGPTANAPVRPGAAWEVSSFRSFSCSLISALSCCQRLAIARSVCFVGGGDGGDLARSQARAPVDQRHPRQVLQLLTEVVGGVHDDLLEADHRRGSGLDGDVLGDLDLTDHLHDTVVGLRHGGGKSGEDGFGGVLGIQGVGLASQPAVPSIGTHHFQGADAMSSDRASQSCAVGTGALDAEGQLPAERGCPLDQLGVAAGISHERATVQDGAELIDRDCDVDVLVGVDTDDDSTVRGNLLHAHDACSNRVSDAGRSGGRDCDGTVAIRLL